MSKRPFRLTAPVLREHPLQKQIADVLRLEIAPPGKVSKQGVCWFSIDHANYAGEVPGIRVGRGIVAGVPDALVLFRGRAHWLEVKAEDGQLSVPQQSVTAALLIAGTCVGVVRDATEALRCLDSWGIPRSHRTRV